MARNWLKCGGKSGIARIPASLFLISITVLFLLQPSMVRGDLSPFGGSTTIVPAKNALLFGSSGNVKIDIPVPGIAVRIEVPREFLQGVVSGENDTHWITSNIRNDYYYYNVVDESAHWTYDWHDNASDGACFKPNFSYYDTNAPYCVEIWNYLNSPLLKQPDRTIYCYVPGPTSNYDSASACPANYFDHSLFPHHVFDYTYLVGVDYCQGSNIDEYVFGCFTAPRFVMFHNLVSPTLAGLYKFTLFVANRTNILGYPDFVHAWNTTLYVPVSMSFNAGGISGYICDAGSGPPFCTNRIHAKGIVYAESVSTGAIVARAYVNQSLCNIGTCGVFTLTGLQPGSYYVEGSAGNDTYYYPTGVAYSLTTYSYPASPQMVTVLANSIRSIGQLPLRRAPIVCGSISYTNSIGSPITSEALNITVEGTDASGHVFRFRGLAGGTSSDTFEIATGVGVKYVGTDPYGTEFAGLPAPEDIGPSGYTLTVKVWVSNFTQVTPATATILSSPGTAIPACPTAPGVSLSPNPVIVRLGGIIDGTVQFCNTVQSCQLESPAQATIITGAPFAGNILIEVFDNLGILRGLTVVNGTLPDGDAGYESCSYTDTCTAVPFAITGFSEYYNHSLSGVWKEDDYGLPDGTYSLEVYMRGYELTSTSPTLITITGGSTQTVFAYMTRGGAFEVTVGSYDSRAGLVINGTRVIQAEVPWRFLNSSIPVTARVYFYGSAGGLVGYVEALMEIGPEFQNEIGVTAFTDYYFTVDFSGQNWSLRDIWFYGYTPTYIADNSYTISAYTLGYVAQYPGGIVVPNQLVGFNQAAITLFIANEIDLTAPIFSNPQTFGTTPEYDHAIGQVFSGPLMGAEMANVTAGDSTLGFNIFGFGGMELSNTTLCNTYVQLRGLLDICGQGHFFYVSPAGTLFFDYGLDALNYSVVLPEFGFNYHFLQILSTPYVAFNDLLLQQGVVLQAVEMGEVTQQGSVVGYCNSPIFGICLANPPSNIAPLSWVQVQASNSTYTGTTATFDGLYDGVGALFLPAGTYTITFTDPQYQSQTVVNVLVSWGGAPTAISPSAPLCPAGTSC